MQNSTFIKEFYTLPVDLQQEVVDFIEYLITKYKLKATDQKDSKNLSVKKSNRGSAKGLIIMSDDFDEPLEDFKEYM